MTESPPVVHVVDDDASICRALERLLRSAGYDVVTHTSVVEFLEAPRPSPPSCLVLDVRMPMVDGLTLLRRLTAEGSTIPAIFITAHDDAKTRAEAREAGGMCYLTKPFDDEAFLGAIRESLSGPGST